ncbi:hypothetical protein BJX66DRAFT_294514 [Aspergillus keveii]|uniref:Uncharacterized protein n=1 Tax=Aspergillus keveii TaxID=714993 RepID=A0ABR4GIZ3_9EURO
MQHQALRRIHPREFPPPTRGHQTPRPGIRYRDGIRHVQGRQTHRQEPPRPHGALSDDTGCRLRAPLPHGDQTLHQG